MAGELQLNFGASRSVAQSFSWREGRFANWSVILGDNRFRLHKYNLARGSWFFEASMADAYESSTTDITSLLPRPCWSFFPDVLDAIYGEGKEARDNDGVLTKDNAVQLLVAADVLGMQQLFERSGSFLKENMMKHCYTFWLACLEFDRPLSHSLTQVISSALDNVAKQFERLRWTEEERLFKVHYEDMLELLRNKALVVCSEPQLAQFVLKYGKAQGLLEDNTFGNWEARTKPFVRYLPVYRENEFQLKLVANETYFVENLSSASSLQVGMSVLVVSDPEKYQLECEASNLSWPDGPGGPRIRKLGRKGDIRRIQDDVVWFKDELGSVPVRALVGFENRLVGVDSRSLAYHVSKDVDSRDKFLTGALFGARVHGTDEGDGWIKINNFDKKILWAELANSIRWPLVRRQLRNSTCAIAKYTGSPIHNSAGTDACVTWEHEELAQFPIQFCFFCCPQLFPSRSAFCSARNQPRPSYMAPLQNNQVTVLLYFAGRETPDYDGPVYSDPTTSGALQFRLQVYPKGFQTPEAGMWALSAYVEIVALDTWPQLWEFRNVAYSIKCVPWKEECKDATFKRTDVFTFNHEGNNDNRGWNDFLTSGIVEDLNSLTSPDGYLIIQAEVDPHTTLEGPEPMMRNEQR